MARLKREQRTVAPRLRYDRVARGVIQRLRDALEDAVPDGTTMVVTITAPIHVPAKTASVLEEKIRAALARRAHPGIRETIHNNRITVSFVRNGGSRPSKIAGFVHNPETDPEVLLELVRTGATLEAL